MLTVSNKQMKWLITGGCGFIGLSLVKSLVVTENNYVRIVDNLSVGSTKDLARICSYDLIDTDKISPFSSSVLDEKGLQVELITADVLDESLAKEAAAGCDVIVHLAANTGVGPSVLDPRMDLHVNVFGTFNYLEAARIVGVEKFILASSGAPAGDIAPPIHEEVAPHPVSPYGASKLACEGYCSAYSNTFSVSTICLRFGNVYGPLTSKKESIVAKFIKRAIAGETLEIYGDGSQTRDFIFIDDLIEAVRLSASNTSISGEIFQIATNIETTVGEMVDHLLPLLEANGIENIKVLHTEKRQGDVMRNYSDTSKAKRLLGWECKVDLAEGLKKTTNWYFKPI